MFTNEERARRLFETARKALSAHEQQFVPQDQSVLNLVTGAGGNPTGYLYGGLTVSLGIRAILQHLGLEANHFERILDLGCGTARVLRWFGDMTPGTELHGADIHGESITWSADNVPFARFLRNDPLPPLPYPDRNFDLIFAISFFTHLNEEYQYAWLLELQRIAKPGALILATVHGEDQAAGGLWANEYQEFLKRGFFYKRARQRATVEGLPDFYQVAFHSKDYVDRAWPEFFDIGAYIKHGSIYGQELVVLKKKGDAPQSSTPYPLLDLPIAALDHPSIGAVVDDFHLDVTGWAFYPRRDESARLSLWLDGVRIHTCTADLARTDVGAFFYAHENAQCPGFVTRISTEHVAKGEHILWLSAADDWMPLCTTYFVVRLNPWLRFYNRGQRRANRTIHDLKRASAWIRLRVRLRTRLKKLLVRIHSRNSRK
jgi:SAM-dependent methyltransferase